MHWNVSSFIIHSPSRITFKPLPVLFPGRQTTSIEAILLSGRFTYSLWRAVNDAPLKPSEPQKRIRRGSHTFPELYRRPIRELALPNGLKRLHDDHNSFIRPLKISVRSQVSRILRVEACNESVRQSYLC